MKRVLLRGKPFAEPLPEGFLYHGLSVFTTLRVEGGGAPLAGGAPPPPPAPRRGPRASLPGGWGFPGGLQAAFPKAPCLRLRFTVGEGVRLSEAKPYTPLPPSLYREGVRVRLTRYRVHPDLARYKTGNYLPYRLALEEARKEGAFEGLLLDAFGHVVDGSRTSPLLFREGTLYLLEGGLEGITREKVAEAARGLGLRVERSFFRPEGLRGHLLLAGSGVGLLPVGPPPPELLPLIEAFLPRCYTE